MMKILLNLVLMVTVISFCSCDDRQSSSRTILNNKSGYKINIEAYKNGMIDPTNSFTIEANDKTVVCESSPRGKTLEPSWDTINQYYDSIIVIYQSSSVKKSIHRSWRDSSAVCDNCVPFTSNRNVTNENNFPSTIEKKRKKYLIGYFEYTFTEDDYLFAKD